MIARLDLMPWLIEPFELAFMRHALGALILIGLSCATVGVYVVFRRMAFIGDAMAHTMLPGIVVAYFAGLSLTLGALAAGVVTAFAIGWLAHRGEIREDAAIGVVFTGMFALGILLMHLRKSYRDFSHILFGNILGVTPSDLWLMAGVAVVILLCLGLFHKELELTTFDSRYAAVIGLRPERLRYLLLLLLTLAIVAAIQAVGVLLTTALLITPAVTASLLSCRLGAIIVMSCLVAVVSGLIGLIVSFYAETPTGASIVLVCTVLMLTAQAVRIFLRQSAQRKR